jgi:hypothetical protein
VRQELELIYPQGSVRISLSDRDEFEEALAGAVEAMTEKKGSELLVTG